MSIPWPFRKGRGLSPLIEVPFLIALLPLLPPLTSVLLPLLAFPLPPILACPLLYCSLLLHWCCGRPIAHPLTLHLPLLLTLLRLPLLLLQPLLQLRLPR